MYGDVVIPGVTHSLILRVHPAVLPIGGICRYCIPMIHPLGMYIRGIYTHEDDGRP